MNTTLFQIAASANGFLVAVLWFDLMFDVQVLRHRAADALPPHILESIAAYYRRVTTTASPMGRLVALAMVTLVAALVAQTIRHDMPRWASAVSIVPAAIGIGLAVARVFGRAQRLGARTDSPEVASGLARSILRDHLVCLGAMLTVVGSQIAGA